MSFAKSTIVLRVSVCLFCFVLFGACSSQNRTSPSDANGQRDPYVIHTVNQPGETLGIIAAWYTKRSSNWQAIAKANPNVNPNRIRLGQTILIPRELVVERNPLPATFVKHGSAVATRPGSSSDTATTAAASGEKSSENAAVKAEQTDSASTADAQAAPVTDSGVSSPESAVATTSDTTTASSGASDSAAAANTPPPADAGSTGTVKKVGDLQPEDSAGTPGEQPNGDAEREKLLNELLNE